MRTSAGVYTTNTPLRPHLEQKCASTARAAPHTSQNIAARIYSASYYPSSFSIVAALDSRRPPRMIK